MFDIGTGNGERIDLVHHTSMAKCPIQEDRIKWKDPSQAFSRISTLLKNPLSQLEVYTALVLGLPQTHETRGHTTPKTEPAAGRMESGLSGNTSLRRLGTRHAGESLTTPCPSPFSSSVTEQHNPFSTHQRRGRR